VHVLDAEAKPAAPASVCIDTAPIDTAPIDTAPIDTAPIDTASIDDALGDRDHLRRGVDAEHVSVRPAGRQ